MTPDTQANNQPSPVQDPKNSGEPDAGSLEEPSSAATPSVPFKIKQNPLKRFTTVTAGVNLYLLAFFIVIAVAGVVVYIAMSQDSANTKITIEDAELTDQIIDDLLQNESRVGDVTQTLTVEANTIFSGKILVKDSLDVAGSINVGGPLTLPGITVSGSSTFDDVEVGNNLSILGNSSVQGTLSVQNSLNVTGNGTFTGRLSADSISASSIELLGDLQITRHIDSGGAAPSIARGDSVGSGGTVSISGTDTAGTITINTGNGPSAGILATITFVNEFNGTPHVIFSAVNADAAGLDAYIQRNTGSFTLRCSSTPDASSTFIFDYIALE